jgi:hypothetical protein
MFRAKNSKTKIYGGVYTMVILLLSFLLNLVVGCQSLDGTGEKYAINSTEFEGGSYSSAESRKPAFSTTLKNNVEVNVYDVMLEDNQVVIDYEYDDSQGKAVNRTLKVDTLLSSFFILDQNNQMLTGYEIHAEGTDQYRAKIISHDKSLAVTSFTDTDSTIIFEMITDGQTDDIQFANTAELGQAVDLYDSVYNQGADPGDFSSQQQELLDKAETLSEWANLFEEFSSQMEIETANFLASNPDLKTWYEDEHGAYPVMSPLGLICDLVNVAEYICQMKSWGEVCEWVHVAKMICDILKKHGLLE